MLRVKRVYAAVAASLFFAALESKSMNNVPDSQILLGGRAIFQDYQDTGIGLAWGVVPHANISTCEVAAFMRSKTLSAKLDQHQGVIRNFLVDTVNGQVLLALPPQHFLHPFFSTPYHRSHVKIESLLQDAGSGFMILESFGNWSTLSVGILKLSDTPKSRRIQLLQGFSIDVCTTLYTDFLDSAYGKLQSYQQARERIGYRCGAEAKIFDKNSELYRKKGGRFDFLISLSVLAEVPKSMHPFSHEGNMLLGAQIDETGRLSMQFIEMKTISTCLDVE